VFWGQLTLAREEPIMPFEGDITQFKISPPVVETPAQRTIRQARELIARPDRWARNWESGEARCILGALRHVHNGNAHKPGTGGAQDYVMRVLRRRGYTGITTFNDNHAAHEHVLAVLDAAYDMAGKPEGAKVDLSAIPRKAENTRPPTMLKPQFIVMKSRPTVGDAVEHIAATRFASFPDRAFPTPRKHPLDLAFLVAAKFALRRMI
jgi:hypothetical protein